MNPVWHSASESAELLGLGWMMGMATIVFLGVFLAYTLYAYAPGQKEAMERHAMLPFDDGADS